MEQQTFRVTGYHPAFPKPEVFLMQWARMEESGELVASALFSDGKGYPCARFSSVFEFSEGDMSALMSALASGILRNWLKTEFPQYDHGQISIRVEPGAT